MRKTLPDQYISEVILLLPSVREAEREYLNKMKYVIEDFCQEKSITNIDDIYQEFGTPQETVTEYLSATEMKPLLKHLHRKRLLQRITLSVAICLALVVCLLSVMLYQSYRYIEEEQGLIVAEHVVSTQTVTGTKTYDYTDDNHNILWSVSITATFAFDGKTATLISCTPSAFSNNSAWTVEQVTSSSDHDNEATAKVTMIKHRMGTLTYYNYTESVSIYCSPTGDIS